ncbi:hypothetical protein JRQ81_009943, partial [Phrynocephalus forsythii]
SRQWGHGGPRQPRWHPAPSPAVPQRGASPAVPLLPGKRAPSPRPAGPTFLVAEGQGVTLTKGKVFPKLRKRSPPGSSESASDKEEEEATDYVFRILYPGMQLEFAPQDLMDSPASALPSMWQPGLQKSSWSSCSLSGSTETGPAAAMKGEEAELGFFWEAGGVGGCWGHRSRQGKQWVGEEFRGVCTLGSVLCHPILYLLLLTVAMPGCA